MREILFRGKAANREDGREYRTNYKNGDWVYGLLTDTENYIGFAEMTNENGISSIEVDKNTVGQFTGLTDKNGKKIFEDDIVNCENYHGKVRGIIQYYGSCFYLACSSGYSDEYLFNCSNIEVIGNIHDNKELLGG